MQQDQPLICWPSLCGWCVMRSQFLSGCGEWDPKSNIVPLSYFIMSLSSHGILMNFGSLWDIFEANPLRWNPLSFDALHWNATSLADDRMAKWRLLGKMSAALLGIILPITWEIGNFGLTYRERWASFLWGRCVSCFFLAALWKSVASQQVSYSMTGSFKLQISKVHGGRQHVYNLHVKLQPNCEIRSSCDIQLTYRVVILHTDTEPEVWPSPE